jgi:hypothetical protein
VDVDRAVVRPAKRAVVLSGAEPRIGRSSTGAWSCAEEWLLKEHGPRGPAPVWSMAAEPRA